MAILAWTTTALSAMPVMIPWAKVLAALRYVGLLLLGVILWRTDLGAVGEALAGARVPTLVAAFAVSLVSLGVKAMRWRSMLATQGLSYPVLDTAGGILPFELREDVRATGWNDLAKSNDGCISNRTENIHELSFLI